MNINELKNLISNFEDSDFGEPVFSPAPEKMPEITPPNGVHPRMGFTKERLPKILENIEKGDNKYAYAEIMRLSDAECDGVLRDFTSQDVSNNCRTANCEIHNIILCKAFRYAAYGEKEYGYEAIYALKNYLATCDKNMETSYAIAYHISITMTSAMSVIGCIYDWCYPLLTDKDKKQLVGAATSKCAIKLEYPDYPPIKGGGVCGHQAGPPFLTGWVPFVLAVYDEYPEYYNVIFDMVLHTIVPGQNEVIKSGFHGQGVSYAASRFSNMVKAECWFSYMFNGERHLFSPKMEEVCVTFLKTIRPDGEMLRIGDDFFQGRRFSHTIICALLGAGLYKNPVLKDFAARQTSDFSIFWVYGMTPIDVVLFNDSAVERRGSDSLPLVSCYGDPTGAILAKTAHNDKSAGMVYMKIGASGTTNHEHKDCGDFQIYHNGMLIPSSGCYAGYGCSHDLGYYKQTISKNSILVYNPNMKDNGKWIYSGGQRIDDASNKEPQTLEEWKECPNYNRAKTLYGGFKTTVENGCEEYCYSYIAGDITNAYDKETVTEVKRHMVCFATGNKVNPMAFVIFDRIVSVDENYKKTILLHTQNVPLNTEVNQKPCSVVTNLMSRLYIQSCLTEVDHTFVGGKGREFMVNGKNCSPDFLGRVEGIKSEYNAEQCIGRIEISPKAPAKENNIITAMYVGPDTDCSPYLALNTNIYQPYHQVKELNGSNVVGAGLLNHAVIFSKDGEYIKGEFSVNIPTDTKKCLVCGLEGGKWRTRNGRIYDVSGEECFAEVAVDNQNELVMVKC